MTGPRRTAGGLVRGLLALVTLLALVLGLPAALWLVGGDPLAGGLPGVQDLLQPDDGTLFLRVLVVVGWLAWATFTFSVLLEIATWLRGRPAPRLPALGLQQRAAASLVGAVAVLFTLTAPAMAATSVQPAAQTVSATTQVAAPVGADTDTASSAPASQRTPAVAATQTQVRQHIVGPGESLWAIAERELGDGARFTEIAALNYGQPQPDGRSLDTDHWIYPGWTLQLPAEQPTSQVAHSRVVERGDTLAEIAEQEYGDPGRFPEIAAASRDIVQPGGYRLTDPDVIDVGWTLQIPAAEPATTTPDAVATPQGDSTIPPGAQPPGEAEQPAPGNDAAASNPNDVPAVPGAGSSGTGAPEVGTAPEAGTAGAVPPAPAGTTGDTGPARPTAAPSPAGTATAAAPDSAAPSASADIDAEESFPVRTTAGVGALLAAGVLGLLATRRGAQQRRRRPGRTLPLPTGQSAQVEQDLRAVASSLDVATVDVALRTLAAHCSAAQQPLPAVRAARLTQEQFELYLAEPATLPEPWTGTADASVWTLPAGADEVLDPAAVVDVPAPYPSLVTIGQDAEDGHVLLDLEHLGALGISGDPTDTRELLAAIAVGLATSRWADDLQVTLVGAYPELEDILQTGRIRYLPAIGHVLDDLTARADLDRAVLSEHGAADLHHARAAGTAPDVWTPEIVLLAGQISPAQRGQLEQLVEQLPRVAIAAVTGGAPLGEWVVRLDGDRAVLEPIGLQISPQRLDEETYGRTLDVLAMADEDDEAGSSVPDVPELTLTDLPTATAAPDIEGTAQSFEADIALQPAAAVTATSVRIDLTATPATAVDTDSDTDTDEQPARLDQQAEMPAPVVEPTAVVTGADNASTEPGVPTGTATVRDQPVPDLLAVDLPVALPKQGQDSRHDQKFAEDREETSAQVHALQPKAPRVLVLGPVELIGTSGPLPQPSHARRYTELAAFLALNPDSDAKTIRGAYFAGGQRREDTAVHQAISRLRRWLGADEFLPKNPTAGRYRLGEAVSSDWQDWNRLLPDGARAASSEALEQALALVRQRPFYGTQEAVDKRAAKGYAWAEHTAQLMVCAIVDAAHELARRRLIEGRWRGVMDATAKGMLVEHGVQRLMRARILAARAGGDSDSEQREVARLLDIVEELGDELEPESTDLLEQLRDPSAARVEQLATQAL